VVTVALAPTRSPNAQPPALALTVASALTRALSPSLALVPGRASALAARSTCAPRPPASS